MESSQILAECIKERLPGINHTNVRDWLDTCVEYGALIHNRGEKPHHTFISMYAHLYTLSGDPHKAHFLYDLAWREAMTTKKNRTYNQFRAHMFAAMALCRVEQGIDQMQDAIRLSKQAIEHAPNQNLALLAMGSALRFAGANTKILSSALQYIDEAESVLKRIDVTNRSCFNMFDKLTPTEFSKKQADELAACTQRRAEILSKKNSVQQQPHTPPTLVQDLTLQQPSTPEQDRTPEQTVPSTPVQQTTPNRKRAAPDSPEEIQMLRESTDKVIDFIRETKRLRDGVAESNKLFKTQLEAAHARIISLEEQLQQTTPSEQLRRDLEAANARLMSVDQRLQQSKISELLLSTKVSEVSEQLSTAHHNTAAAASKVTALENEVAAEKTKSVRLEQQNGQHQRLLESTDERLRVALEEQLKEVDRANDLATKLDACQVQNTMLKNELDTMRQATSLASRIQHELNTSRLHYDQLFGLFQCSKSCAGDDFETHLSLARKELDDAKALTAKYKLEMATQTLAALSTAKAPLAGKIGELESSVQHLQRELEAAKQRAAEAEKNADYHQLNYKQLHRYLYGTVTVPACGICNTCGRSM